MSDLDIKKINDTALRVQRLCGEISEAQAVLEDLHLPAGSIRLEAVLTGYSSTGPKSKHLSLGPEHREWVIQRLQQRVLDFQNELREIGQFVYPGKQTDAAPMPGVEPHHTTSRL